MSPLLRLYLGFTHVSEPLWRLAHRRRLARGKETTERLGEKYGRYTTPRPDGRVLWFHALSVGESLALVPLIERALTDLPAAHVVLTTSTATSAEALGKANLPGRCIHILLPIDTPRAVRRFLDHWRPDIAAFAELDFWPRLMIETHRRGIPMVLVNSRMPEKNLVRRRRLGSAMTEILGLFERMLVQDADSCERFVALGADRRNISVVGALKSAARPLPVDTDELERLRAVIGDRPVWLAAATWESEHPLMAEAHALVRDACPDAFLIVAPRQMRHADGCEAAMREMFHDVSRRSRGEAIGSDTQVYIADTIGEMGLWYRLAPVSFVGHSLDPRNEGLEGKNPFEAAALGSVVLHGPAVSYFDESYAALAKAGAAVMINNDIELANSVIRLLDDDERKPMLDGAARVIAARKGVLENTWTLLRKSLPD